MPTLNINGRSVTVGDEFLKLSPDEQNQTVDEIAGQMPKAAPTGALDQASDFAQGLGAGVKHGTFGAAGLPADAARALAYGADWIKAKAQGRPIEDVTREAEARALVPSAALAPYTKEGLEKGYQANEGTFYQPKGFAGRVGETIGEFAPTAALPLGQAGALTRLGMGAVLPGVAAAGAAEATGNPLAGAAAAFITPFAAARAITPLRTLAGRGEANQLLQDAGVPLTAGQRTGNRRLQWLESTTGDAIGAGGASANMMERQAAGFTAAAAEHMGEQAERLTPEVFNRARTRIGGEFRDLSRTYNLDTQVGGLQNRITGILQDHLPDMTTENQNRFLNIITNRLAPNIQNGQMPGARYQGLRSSLTNIAQGASKGQDQPFALAVRGLRNALDDGMEATIQAGGNAADIGRWGTARGQWGAMRTLEDGINAGGPEAARGHISPARLRAAVGERTSLARGQTEMGELARAGETSMTALPQSGTSPREAVRSIMTALGAAGGAAAGQSFGHGTEGALAGAVGAAVAPAVVGRAVMSRPVQAYLGNAVFPHQPDTRVQAFLRSLGRARTAASTPNVDDGR